MKKKLALNPTTIRHLGAELTRARGGDIHPWPDPPPRLVSLASCPEQATCWPPP
ncbi:MAG: hypothetical protein ACM358_05645 [Gemmatimonadota bacterium]